MSDETMSDECGWCGRNLYICPDCRNCSAHCHCDDEED
jgi:hypothetical protein